MIRSIRISNFALIGEAALEFDVGFTVFTGETGAGKSILIDAINLLVGERASQSQIRSGAEEAEVSGVFEVDRAGLPIVTLLDELDIPAPDGTIIVRRKIAHSDRSRILVNQTPVPLAALKRLGDMLVDLHGQHDHQSLLAEETHAAIIDDLPGVWEPKQRYGAAWAAYGAVKGELDTFEAKAAALAERREILDFQYKEINSLSLRAGEEEELEQELRLLSSSAVRSTAAAEIVALLAASETSIEKQISSVRKKLESLARCDASVAPWLNDVGNALATFTELERYCAAYLDAIGEAANPKRIDFCNERLAKIQRLKKKYNCAYAGLIEKCAKVKLDLASVENIDADRSEIAGRTDKALASCKQAGSALSSARKKAAAAFDTKTGALMDKLGIRGGVFKTEFLPNVDPTPHGMESLRFLVRTNPGESMLPLAATASGGEISRLMLAVKSVLAEHDRIPILIFDEIDTGIGGTLAGNVAQALIDLAATHQVLCISHLHQIASVADHHFHVYKEAEGGRTVTRVKHLDSKERVNEIARMLGGDSSAARAHAKSLLVKKTGSS